MDMTRIEEIRREILDGKEPNPDELNEAIALLCGVHRVNREVRTAEARGKKRQPKSPGLANAVNPMDVEAIAKSLGF